MELGARASQLLLLLLRRHTACQEHERWRRLAMHPQSDGQSLTPAALAATAEATTTDEFLASCLAQRLLQAASLSLAAQA